MNVQNIIHRRSHTYLDLVEWKKTLDENDAVVFGS